MPSTAIRREAAASPNACPEHVAIIMDGNGRWAAARHLPKIAGHREGARAVRRTIEAAIENGVAWLTIYAFSSENWRRPTGEVLDLTGLLRQYLKSELAELKANGVRLRVIGDRARFDPDIQHDLAKAEGDTSTNTRLNLTVALSYGARAEIAAAARKLAEAARDGTLDPRQIDEDRLAGALATAGDAGSGPDHPHLRRAAAVQFSALAGRIRGTGVSGRAVAGLRSRAFCRGAGRVRAPGAAVWCPPWLSARQDRWADLGIRVISALVLAPIALACVWVGGTAFAVIVAAVVLGLAVEWLSLCRRSSRRAAACRSGLRHARTAWRCFGCATIRPRVALTCYSCCSSSGLAISELTWSAGWIGGPRLAPLISPGKTWSGAVGGLLAASPPVRSWRHFLSRRRDLASLLIAAGLGVVAQAGDLLESFVKRGLR